MCPIIARNSGHRSSGNEIPSFVERLYYSSGMGSNQWILSIVDNGRIGCLSAHKFYPWSALFNVLYGYRWIIALGYCLFHLWIPWDLVFWSCVWFRFIANYIGVILGCRFLERFSRENNLIDLCKQLLIRKKHLHNFHSIFVFHQRRFSWVSGD